MTIADGQNLWPAKAKPLPSHCLRALFPDHGLKKEITYATAARVGDMHVCPMVTVLVPHVGGPVTTSGVSAGADRRHARRANGRHVYVRWPTGCYRHGRSDRFGRWPAPGAAWVTQPLMEALLSLATLPSCPVELVIEARPEIGVIPWPKLYRRNSLRARIWTPDRAHVWTGCFDHGLPVLWAKLLTRRPGNKSGSNEVRPATSEPGRS